MKKYFIHLFQTFVCGALDFDVFFSFHVRTLSPLLVFCTDFSTFSHFPNEKNGMGKKDINWIHFNWNWISEWPSKAMLHHSQSPLTELSGRWIHFTTQTPKLHVYEQSQQKIWLITARVYICQWVLCVCGCGCHVQLKKVIFRHHPKWVCAVATQFIWHYRCRVFTRVYAQMLLQYFYGGCVWLGFCIATFSHAFMLGHSFFYWFPSRAVFIRFDAHIML